MRERVLSAIDVRLRAHPWGVGGSLITSNHPNLDAVIDELVDAGVPKETLVDEATTGLPDKRLRSPVGWVLRKLQMIDPAAVARLAQAAADEQQAAEQARRDRRLKHAGRLGFQYADFCLDEGQVDEALAEDFPDTADFDLRSVAKERWKEGCKLHEADPVWRRKMGLE